jgi:hypothetical protein
VILFLKRRKREEMEQDDEMKNSKFFFFFSSRDDEGERVGNVGHLERQSGPPTDNNKTLVASSTNTTDVVAQDIHAQPPRPKTYGPIQFPTIGNKTDKKRSTRCLRDFISLELTNLLLKVVAVVVVELSVGLCPTIISDVFLPEFRRLCWPERRPQHLERLKSSESQEAKVIGSN